jgi:GT2 family glycosyltransferase
MSDPIRISVIVPSYGRPAALARCLRAVAQLRHQAIEVIVVADPDGLDAVAKLPFAERLTCLQQGQPNISNARNMGISRAAGEVVAFLDDDAVPEPTWACHIADAFANPTLDAVTGPVLGRNGISVQWGYMAVDTIGRDKKLAPNASVPDGSALKLHGTNMAFRRAVFERIGGFDPAFPFFLDDTDFALRAAEAGGGGAAFLDGAVVHHGFAASCRRNSDRVPLSLFDIGASTAVFLRKHAPMADHGQIYRQLEADQRARLLRLARKRRLGPPEIRNLMESLQDGWTEGRTRSFGSGNIHPASFAFRPLREEVLPDMQVIGGPSWRRSRARRKAAELVAQGVPVSLFLFEPTPRKHKVAFTAEGWWEQTGGVFGPADRTEARLQAWSLAGRIARERLRVKTPRGI